MTRQILKKNNELLKLNGEGFSKPRPWSYYMSLTIPKEKISEDLTNFPVLVNLSTSSGVSSTDVSSIFNILGDSSKKIKIEDANNNQLYCEIESWDSGSNSAQLWVKVPAVSASQDTQLTLYYDSLQYDNTSYVGDTNSSAAQNVWDSTYEAVWHLAETSQSGTRFDSTSNEYSGTPVNADTYAVSGKINGADAFDGVDEYIDTSVNLNGYTEFTLSTWVNISAYQNDTVGLVSTRDGAPKLIQLGVFSAAVNYEPAFYVYNGSPNNSIINDVGITLSDGDTTWYHLQGTYDTTNGLKFYLNGNQEGTPKAAVGAVGLNTNFLLGKDSYTLGGNRRLNGKLDEVRISNVERSAGYAKADYDSQNDDLIVFEVPFSNTYSMAFDGVDDYFGSIGTGYEIGTNDFTLSLWFKDNGAGTSERLISTGASNNTQLGYTVFYDQGLGVIDFGACDGSGRNIQQANANGTVDVDDGNWHHAIGIFTHSSGNWDVYIDGVKETTKAQVNLGSYAAGNITNTHNLEIGAHVGGGGLYYTGFIDEVTMWSKALSESNVSEIYNNGSPIDISNHSEFGSCVGYWRMGDGATFNQQIPSQWFMPDLSTQSNNMSSNAMAIVSRTTDVPS